MPRADKTKKVRKPASIRVGKTEKATFQAIGRAPKFPSKLVDLKKQRKS